MDLSTRLRIPPVTLNLIIINTIIFLAMAIVPAINHILGRYCSLYYLTSEAFYPWQLFTYMFIHGNFWHLFFNMFALYMFGRMMEQVLGSTKFLFYYITCGLGAAIIQEGIFAIMIANYLQGMPNQAELVELLRQGINNRMAYYNVIGEFAVSPDLINLYELYNTQVVGASGAIYGILLAFGFMFPNATIYLLIPPMPLKAKWMVIGYAVLELTLGVYNSQADTVAHFAHLGGMLFGLLLLLYWRKKHIIGGPYI